MGFLNMKESINTMQIRSLVRRWMPMAFVLAAATLAGCATFAPATPEQIVEKRATEYWKARVEGQVDKAYALSTPSYRKVRSEAQFKMQFGAGAAVKSADVANVTCAAEKCTVKVKLGVQPALLRLNIGTVETYLDEIWLLEDGQWWHYQEL